ncbi:MAG: PKD domain-containing protein, partial [Bacteroidia bacterium]|nr:PKD domain-containing protein [Bacteroidia bacterium]
MKTIKKLFGMIILVLLSAKLFSQNCPVADFSFTGSCYGQETQFNDLSVDTANTIVSWYWDFGDSTNSLAQSPAHAFPDTGSYSVTLVVTNDFPCNDTIIKIVTINQSPSITFSTTNSSCYGSCNGTATANVSGGSPPYTYMWDNVQTTQTATSLYAGTHTVTVEDVNGCTVTASVTITQPAALTASISSQTNVTCNGASNGSATVTASGGIPPYSYLWSNNQTTPTAIGLCAGTHAVTVYDANGCTGVASATINQPTAITTSFSTTNVNCNGGNNGAVNLTVSGGTQPYTYMWSNGAATQDISGLTAGIYTLTINDALGCTKTTSATITQPASALSATITNVTNVSCFEACNGTATATASGGTAPYTYLWNDPLPAQITQTATNLCAGIYTVTVTDANGCTKTTSPTITQPSSTVTVTISSFTNVTCYGVCNGLATATASDGIPPYSYLWSNSATGSSATGLCAGTNTITVTDDSSACSVASVTLQQPSQITITTTKTNASCWGVCDGSATATVSGGTPPYAYSWSDPLFQATPTATALCAGSYTVTVTDALNCTKTKTVTITQPSEIIISVTGTPPSSAISCDGSLIAIASGGTPTYSYQWNNGWTTSATTGLCAGVYTITITDTSGCTAMETIDFTFDTYISGYVYHDINANCLYDSTDT